MIDVRCELCGREARTTRHHLVPRSRKRHERDAYTLARRHATIGPLRGAPELQAYLEWIRTRPPSTYFGSRDAKH